MSKYLILLVVMMACTSPHKKESKPNEIKENIVTDIYKQLPKSANIKNILLVPQNSCGGCRQYIFSQYRELEKMNNLLVIYLNNGDTSNKPPNAKQIPVLGSQSFERKYDLYGITLIKLKGDSISSKQEINPNNVEEVVNDLLNNANQGLKIR